MYSPPTRPVVLRQELGRPLVTPAAKIPINVRTATEAAGSQIRALISELAASERSTRQRFRDLRTGTCCVGVDERARSATCHGSSGRLHFTGSASWGV
jgi:hypothetical protein